MNALLYVFHILWRAFLSFYTLVQDNLLFSLIFMFSVRLHYTMRWRFEPNYVTQRFPQATFNN